MRHRIGNLFEILLGRRILGLTFARFQGRVGKGVKVSSQAQVLGWKSVKIGSGSVICDHVCFNINLRNQGVCLSIGEKSFIGSSSFFSTGAGIELADFCLIGRGCQFLNAGHVTNPRSLYVSSGIEIYPPIRLGTNVWLTNNVTIIGGVSIGFGAVIGAASMITEDIPPLSMAVGNPAKLIKLFNWETSTWVRIDQHKDLNQQLQKHLTRLPSEQAYRSAISDNARNVKLPAKAMGPSKGDIF